MQETTTQESATTILLILLTAVATAIALHWVIGVVQRRFVLWLVPDGLTPHEEPSLKHLFIDWIGNALRTTVWTLLALLIFYLLPQTRTRVDVVWQRLLSLRDSGVNWLLDGGVNVVIIIVTTVFLMRFAKALIRTGFELFESRAVNRGETTAKRRSQTLSAIFRGVLQSVIFLFGTLRILQQLHVNITPILASAGVVGLAVGFGAQSLIKDIFSGFLILLEDQYNVGDTIKIGETTGTVERLTLRATSIRSLDGALTMIPNGTISTVANLSKDWARIVLDVDVDYSEDPDRALRLMLNVARQLRAERADELIEEPVVLGIERLSSAGIGLRLTVKAVANKQAELARELRRRLKLAFDHAGIKAPSREQFVLAPTPVPVPDAASSGAPQTATSNANALPAVQPKETVS